MSFVPPARRWSVRTLCRIAPRSTSAQVRLGIFRGVCTTKRWLETRFKDVEGKDVHAGYNAQQALVLDDGQDLFALLGHDGRGLDQGRLGGDGYGVFRHDLANGDAGALQSLPAVLLPVPQGDDATQDIQKARRFDLQIGR